MSLSQNSTGTVVSRIFLNIYKTFVILTRIIVETASAMMAEATPMGISKILC